MKQKLGLISALMLDARVLIFDEPTSGLDPLMQKVFIDLILEEKKKGKTLFMSSHQFAEIERTCEQVGIIREGKLLAVQSIYQLREARGNNKPRAIHIRFKCCISCSLVLDEKGV